MSRKVCVMGSGAWGTALALAALKSGNDVTLMSVFPEEIEEIRKTSKNKLLPGIDMPESLKLTSDVNVLRDTDMCIISVPSRAVRAACRSIKAAVNSDAILVNVAKGLESQTLMRMSGIISQEMPSNPVVVLSGPSHAEEVARHLPTAVVAASADLRYAKEVQDALSSDTLRIYTNPDVIGVELGGTVKNVIALAAGICDGLGFGDNTKAALMTRGINEIGNLGIALGGRTETFAGLAGIGDLIVTCTSMHSRNRRAGILIGNGASPSAALEEVGTVEGYYATECVWQLAEKNGVEMPITEQIYLVLYKNKSPYEAVSELMLRPAKNEYSVHWL